VPRGDLYFSLSDLISTLYLGKLTI
jgi:hypothetical protein